MILNGNFSSSQILSVYQRLTVFLRQELQHQLWRCRWWEKQSNGKTWWHYNGDTIINYTKILYIMIYIYIYYFCYCNQTWQWKNHWVRWFSQLHPRKKHHFSARTMMLGMFPIYESFLEDKMDVFFELFCEFSQLLFLNHCDYSC